MTFIRAKEIPLRIIRKEISMASYQMRCKVCGNLFPVNSPTDKVPKHTQDGKILKANERIRPCRGSGLTGMVS